MLRLQVSLGCARRLFGDEFEIYVLETGFEYDADLEEAESRFLEKWCASRGLALNWDLNPDWE